MYIECILYLVRIYSLNKDEEEVGDKEDDHKGIKLRNMTNTTKNKCV